VLILATAASLNAQNAKNKLQSRKLKIERDIIQVNQELEQTKQNKSANLNQLILINKKIDKREDLINAIEQEVGGIESQVNTMSDTISHITTTLKSLKEEYARLIYSTYRNRSAYNRLMFIFSSHNFNQAYKRLKYLQQYTEYRKTQIRSITETQRVLAAKKLELEKQKSMKLTLKHSQEEERNILANEKSQKDQKIKSLTSQEKNLLVKLKKNEVALNNLQLAIEKLVAEEIRKADQEKARKTALAAENERKARADADHRAKAKAEADRRAKAVPGTKIPETEKTEAIARVDASRSTAAKSVPVKSNSMSVTAEDVALTGSFAGNKGSLPSPVDRGSIVSSFGEHAHTEYQNIKIKNNGIDISSVSGAKAKAIFDGEVSSVIFIANLNYVVIIRHGDYLSVYSNLEDVTVKKGDRVKIRQSLGTISTGEGETKSRLHFELWQGTIVQNPAGWLKV
jgi:septal ring factor EnvC (AmiA/AmiB activator)